MRKLPLPLLLCALVLAGLAYHFLSTSQENSQPRSPDTVSAPTPARRPAKGVDESGSVTSQQIDSTAPDASAEASPGQDRPREAELETRSTTPDASGQFRRTRILATDLKYPFIRVEEIVTRDPATGGETVARRTGMVADHVLIRLKPGYGEADLLDPVRAQGALVLKKMLGQGMFLVQIPGHDIDAVPQAIADFTRKSGVIAYAEPDYMAYADQKLPDDPQFGDLYGLNNTGQSGGTPDADIDAPEAWELTTGSDVVVGVIDTGVQLDHVDLAANIWVNPGEIANDGIDNDSNGFIDDIHGWDFISNDNDPSDDNKHGTHVSGTIAAIGSNAVGVVGVNWTAKIMALKFLGAGGSGFISDAVDALAYAILMRSSHGVNVRLTSNSWGGDGYSQAMTDVIEQSRAAGMLFVAAAGNNNRDTDAVPHYPSSYTNSNIISVAATDRNDDRSSFSNYGLISVDVGAPGSSIISTVPTNGYQSLSGTSMATPHVAGVAALIWSLSPNASVDEVRQVLLLGADLVPALAGKTATGGRLNALKSLQNLGMRVSRSSPAAGDVLAIAPTNFEVEFTYSYDPITVDASDLTVDSTPADTVSVLDDRTLRFQFNSSPVVAQGQHAMSMGLGSITRLGTNEGVAAFSALFRYDLLPLDIVSTVPAHGSQTRLPLTNLTVLLNEPYDPASAGTNDLLLSQGRITGVLALDPTTLRYTITGVATEATLSITLPAGQLADTNQNPCLAHSISIDLDYATNALPQPTLRIDPPGSMIYAQAAAGRIRPAGDSDRFTMPLDSNQTVTLVIRPDAVLQPSVELRGPANNLLGSAVAGAAGAYAVLQSVPVTVPGIYSIIVGGTGTGDYTLALGLNGGVESESVDGPANDTPGAAQNIDASFAAFGATGSMRGAVLGSIRSTTNIPLYAENFENGLPPASWTKYSSDINGRVRATNSETAAAGSFALLMDRNPSGANTLNEAIWTVDLSGLNEAHLRFSHASWSDETQMMAGDFVNHLNADGIAISDDGIVWRPAWFPVTQSHGAWSEYEISLHDLASAAGMALGSNFRIKFQQYDNYPISNDVLNSDGRGWDELEISRPAPNADWYSFTVQSNEQIALVLDVISDGLADLALADASGNVLISGTNTAENAHKIIRKYPVAHGGTYLARVTGGGQEDYSLTILRQAIFDGEPNDERKDAVDLTGTGAALGAVAYPPALYAIDWRLFPPSIILQIDPLTGRVLNHFNTPPAPTAHNSQINLASDGQHLWFNAGADVSGNTTIYKLDKDTGDVLDSFIPAVPQPTGLGWLADELYILCTNEQIYVFDDTTYALNRLLTPPTTGALRGIAGDAKRGVLLASSLFQNLYKLDPQTGAILDSRNYIGERVGFEQGAAVVADQVYVAESLGFGVNEIAVYDADTLASVRRFQAPVAQLLAGLGGDNVESAEDWYRVQANAGDQLHAETATPSGDVALPLEFWNPLDPAIELYDGAGLVLATNDNSAADGRNAMLIYNVAANGQYFVRVRGAGKTIGEYALKLYGATGEPDLDNDGLPDAWEFQYFHDPAGADAEDDADADGLSNRDELWADTNPTNAASALQLNINTTNLMFESSTARVYWLDMTTNLLTGDWSPYRTNLAGNGGSISVLETNALPAAAFRLGTRSP